MSPVLTRLGCATVKFRSSRFGDTVWLCELSVVTLNLRLELAFASGQSSVRVQKLAHPLLACSDTLLNQFLPDTRPALGSFHLLEAGINVNKKRCIAEPRKTSGFLGSVLMEAAGADFKYFSLGHDRQLIFMAFDKGIFHRDSLAKYAMAFLKMSRSIVALANYARRRAISIWSALISLAVLSRKRPEASTLNQLSTDCEENPRLLATNDADWPPRTNRTASCLNSSVHRARTRSFIKFSPKLTTHNQPKGTFFRGKLKLETAKNTHSNS